MTRTQTVKARILKLFVIWSIALGINYVWEMVQMPLYQGMLWADAGVFWQCLKAAIGDANIVLAVFVIGVVLFREWWWPVRPTVIRLAFLLILGAAIAVVIEVRALDAGRWVYSSRMPLVPVINVGLSPLLQLMILPEISYLLALRTKTTLLCDDNALRFRGNRYSDD